VKPERALALAVACQFLAQIGQARVAALAHEPGNRIGAASAELALVTRPGGLTTEPIPTDGRRGDSAAVSFWDHRNRGGRRRSCCISWRDISQLHAG